MEELKENPIFKQKFRMHHTSFGLQNIIIVCINTLLARLTPQILNLLSDMY